MKKYCFILLSLFANNTNSLYDQSHIIKYTNNYNFTYFSYLNDQIIKEQVLTSLKFDQVSFETVGKIFKMNLFAFGGYLRDADYGTKELQEFRHILSNFRVFSFPYFSFIHNANNLLSLFNFDYYTTGNIAFILQLPVIYFQCLMNVSSHELGHFVASINSGHHIKSKDEINIQMGSIWNLGAATTWLSDPYKFVNSILINSSGVIASLELSKYFFFEKMQDLNYLGVASNIGIGVYPLYGFINYFRLDLAKVKKAADNKSLEDLNTKLNGDFANLNGDFANIFLCLAKYKINDDTIYVSDSEESSSIDKVIKNLNFYYNRYKYSYLLNLVNARALYCICNFSYNAVYKKNIIPEKSTFLFRYMPALYFNIEPFGAIYRLSFLKFFLNRRSMINFDLDYVDSFFKKNNDKNDIYKSIISQACNIKINWINIFNSYKYSLFGLDGEFGCAFNQPCLQRKEIQGTERGWKTVVQYEQDKIIKYHTMIFGRLIVKLNIKIYNTIMSFKIFFEAKNHGYYTGLNLRSGWSVYPLVSFSYIKL